MPSLRQARHVITLANIDTETAVVVMMVMVVMVIVRPWENAVIPPMMMVMMVVMVMVKILRHPFRALRLCCGDAGVIRLQGAQCIWNWL